MKIFIFIFTVIGNILTYITNMIIKIFNLFGFLLTKGGTFVNNACSLGGGVIIKTLILILILVFLFSFMIISNKNSGENNDLISNDKNYSSFLINNAKQGYFENIQNSFYGLIPDQFKSKLNFYNYKLNSYVGNDIYELVGNPREETKSGINDGIYHIKKKGDEQFTYTTLKPKNIILTQEDIKKIKEKYIDYDYNKLPIEIKNIYKFKEFGIPVEEIEDNGTKTWKYDVEKMYYTDDETKTPIKNKVDEFKLPFVNTSKTNEFKFNKIQARIFNDNDKSVTNKLDNMFLFEEDKYKYPRNLYKT